jgi:hypothetical protein
MSAPLRNANAAKPADERREVKTQLRSLATERAAWMRATKGEPLSAWIRRHLNAAAGHSPKP